MGQRGLARLPGRALAVVAVMLAALVPATRVAASGEPAAGWSPTRLFFPTGTLDDGRIVGTLDSTSIVLARSDGTLDPGFDGDGILTIGEGATPVADGDGIIVLSSTAEGQQLRRVLPDGRVDPHYATDGLQQLAAPPSDGLVGRPAVDGSHRLVLMFSSGTVVRLAPDGTPDRAWGRDGRIEPLVGEHPSLMAVHRDGRVDVALQGPVVSPRLRIRRFLPNGDPDPSWGGDGLVDAPSPLNGAPNAMVVTADEGLVYTTIGGFGFRNQYRIRYFGLAHDGSVRADVLDEDSPCNAYMIGLAAAADGSVLVSLNLGAGAVVMRRRADLTIDRTFGEDGYANITSLFARTPVIDRRGRVLVGREHIFELAPNLGPSPVALELGAGPSRQPELGDTYEVATSTWAVPFGSGALCPGSPTDSVATAQHGRFLRWDVSASGRVSSNTYWDVYGDLDGRALAAPIVGIALTPTGHGYWLVGRDGGVFAFGDAPFAGSLGGRHVRSPIIGIAPTASGRGYWLAAADGAGFAFGDAVNLGSMAGRRLNRPIVGIAPSPSGGGYWLVAGDGGVFTYGDARFLGSLGDRRLAAPIVSLTPRATGRGYWLLGRDGGVFAFGDAPFLGSALRPEDPVLTVRPT